MEKNKAFEAARQTLEMVINQHSTRLKYHEEQAAHLQETIFVVFDDLLENYNNSPTVLVGLEHKASYMNFGGNKQLQRQFLLRRQLRHEYQAKKLQQRVDELKVELLAVQQQ